jgi:F0F1-type ATP synthase membrane subunit a
VYVTSLAGIILFLSFLIWGTLELITCQKNRANVRSKNEKVSIPMTFLAVVLGIAFWSLFARYAYYLLVPGNTQSFFQYWFECIRSIL